MEAKELIEAMNRLKVETGSLACSGCGHENSCTIHGCAIIREATDALERQRWISSAERSPKNAGKYLVRLHQVGDIGFHLDETKTVIMRWRGNWHYPVHVPREINDAIEQTVTHWMALPKPPVGGKT